MMLRQLRIDGVWMTHIAPWGELSWTHDDHGCKDAQWSASFPAGARHPLLAVNALVEVMYGGACVWAGALDEPNWPEGRFSATGLSIKAEKFQARDSTGWYPTSVPSTAVDQAAVRGWNVLGRSGVPTTAFVAGEAPAGTVGALLDESAHELGQRWTVRADRIVRMAADPTSYTYVIRPGVVDFGTVMTNYASTVFVTRLSSGGTPAYNAYAVDSAAAAKYGPAEVELDVTKLGSMTLARGQQFAAGRLALRKAQPGWTGTLEVGRNELLTRGGQPADLALVESLQMVRMYVGYDDVAFLDGRTYLDVVIGSTSYNDGSDTITIEPVGAIPSKAVDAIAELYGITV